MTARILVVEEDPLVALGLVQALHLAVFEVVGPATTVALALEFISAEGCDAAVLDINLGEETSEAVALELKKWQIPFLILSGHSQNQHLPAFRGAPLLAEPLRASLFIEELRRCLEISRYFAAPHLD